MSKTPNAVRKLGQARLLLWLLQQESQKVIGKDWLVVETLLSACLGATCSAFYRLEKEVGKATFKAKKIYWLMKRLTPQDRAFFNKMTKERDLDVHVTSPATKPKEKTIPAHQVPNVQVFAPPGVLVPNPETGGAPHFAQSWVIAHETYHGEDEVTQACKRFLELMEDLVKEFQDPA